MCFNHLVDNGVNLVNGLCHTFTLILNLVLLMPLLAILWVTLKHALVTVWKLATANSTTGVIPYLYFKHYFSLQCHLVGGNTNQPYRYQLWHKCELSQGLQRQPGANSHGRTSLPGAKIKFSLPAAAVTRQQKSAVAGIVFRAQVLKALLFRLTPFLTPQLSPWHSKVVLLQVEHMRLKALKIYFHRITE